MSRWLPAPVAHPPAGKASDGPVRDTEPEWTNHPESQGTLPFAAPFSQQARMTSSVPAETGDVDTSATEELHRVPVLDMSLSSVSAPRGVRDARGPSSGRLSPSRRGSGQLMGEAANGAGNTADDVHAALMRLSDEFPVVAHMQRINTGFYRLEGQGTFELSLARNSEKLFVKLDGWNRGVRGELTKFLQSVKVPEAPMDQTPSERSLVHNRVAFNPQERSPVKPGSASGQSRAGKTVENAPVRKAAARKPASGKIGAAAKSGSKPGLSQQTPRRPSQEIAAGLRWREGALYVHSREPLMGDPLVAVRIADEADGIRVVARLLCSGRLTEVRGPALQPLEVRPGRASSNIAALAAYEEMFFIGDPEELSQGAPKSFGCVELGELTAKELSTCLAASWPPEQPLPIRGLIWALRPYFIDWLQRRKRLRLFTNLVISLPDSALRRFSAQGAESASLQSLLDLTERDLLVATLVSTAVDQRSRLYACAAENELPLPLAFSGLRCPCPPTELDQIDGIDGTASQVDRGVMVHWEAFEALLALPNDRPMLLSLGGPGCAQAGKSSLLAELLGISCAVVDRTEADQATSRLGQCRSPAHSPGVDLLQCAAPLSWAADVHGCSLGDPTWTALIATLGATSALTLLHVSSDDFTAQEDERPPAKKPADNRGGSTQLSRRGTASKDSVSTVNSNAGPGMPKITAKPDLMALLKILTDARLAGVGPERARILVIFRDAPTSNAQISPGIQSCLEAALGTNLAGIVALEKLQKLPAAYRQRPLVRLRDKLQQELYLLKEAPRDRPQVPCIDALKQVFSHFYDRLTLAGDRPVLPSDTISVQSYRCQVLSTLLDEAEAKAKGKLREAAFPASEASSQLAKLREEERKLLEADVSGESANDAKIAELAGKLRQLEKSRRELFAMGMSPPVRFFMETVLSENGLSHALVAELGQGLQAWRAPRLAPLMAQRRELLEMRLQLHQDMRGQMEGPQQREMQSVMQRLQQTEQALEQLNITLDTFWEEVAAISDLSNEMQGLGMRGPADVPSPATLKHLFGEWAWHLNCPVQLLFGSPLQCAGPFLVEVLKELGAEQGRELFVISVIGIQSSAKSTLMNFLFGCGFATSAGRCTRGLYCSLMECEERTLLILDTEGLMSLEAEGGGIFDAQLALMAMACSHLVIINHKGELSRQLQDLLEVCLFAMQHLKVCRIQPKLLFVLRDQHDRSHGVHGDALRLMRKHLSEASSHLQLRLDELISLDPGSVFLLPSAFASDLEQHTGREVRWSTGLFAEEAFRLRRKIFREADSLLSTTARTASSEQAAPEFSTLPDWCLHAMSVWRVLDRYGPNLLHYKTIQEIELQREIEETAKQISSQLVRSKGGLSEQCQALLASSTKRLSDGESGNLVDGEFRSSLQAILESFDKRAKAELEKHLQSRRSKLPEAQKEEAKRKLTTPIEYQGELTRYTWSLCLADATDRDQLRALKVHFKTTIEHLWEAEASQSIAEEQARQMFEREWKAFEEDCRGRFERTARSRKQLSEEVCMVFNHVLRQHRHADQSLHILELVPATFLLNSEPFDWTPEHMAKEFLEVRHPSKLREFAATCRPHKGPGAIGRNATDFDILCRCVVPELKKRLSPALSMELPESSTTVPTEEAILEAIQKLNEGLEAEESRYLSRLGVRLQGGQVSLANALQLSLRQSVLESLQAAEVGRAEHQWRVLQSHRQQTQAEFIEMVQRRTSDAGRARMLAELFFDSLGREWLDESLLAVAADIRAQCLHDMPDASGAAERAYQQAFVERNWEEVLEYVLDVNAYLKKIFSGLFEDRKVAILRVQRPQIAGQLGSFFDALTGAIHRFGGQKGGRRTKLSALQGFIRNLAAEARASGHKDGKAWPLLSERFPVVADFDIADANHFAHEFGLHLASLLGEAEVDTLVAQKLESALHLQQTQVWNLIKGCDAVCPCCGSKCDRVDNHTKHSCRHHLLPAFNGWRVAGTCEAALDACLSSKNHEAPKRSDFSDHLYPNLQEYLQAEHPDWLPFPREDRELLADSVLKAAWVNCRIPLLARYDMVDSTPAEWIEAYEEPRRMLGHGAVEVAEARLAPFGYRPEGVLCQAGPVSAANLPQPGAAAAPPQKIDGYAHAQPRPSTVLLSHTYFEQDLDELKALPAGSARHVQERPLFRFRSGSSYTGQWLGNERHGLGVQQWFDGAVYQGTWEHNCAHGQGRFVHTDGDVYCGEWQMNVAHGLGTYTHRLSGSKVTYRGEWIEDLQSGYGVESWDEGCHFEGEFKAGQKNGQGIYYWSDGSRYEGAWRRNAIHGPGYYVGADRREFHGLWQNSAIHGCGAYSWPDGRKYEGEYENDRKSGFGIFSWPDKRRYEGFWLDGKQHGQGRYYHTDGYSLLALWDQGRRVEWLEDTPMPPEILPKSQMEEHSSQQ